MKVKMTVKSGKMLAVMLPHRRRIALGAALLALAVLADLRRVGRLRVRLRRPRPDRAQPLAARSRRLPAVPDPPVLGVLPDRGAGPSNYYRPAFGWAYSLVARGSACSPRRSTPSRWRSISPSPCWWRSAPGGCSRIGEADRRGEVAALAAGLFFAVYPAHAEAVAWVGDQVDLLTALFVLLALFAYLSHKDRGGWTGWPGPFAYLLACLTKEPGTALLLVLGAVEVSEWRREGSAAGGPAPRLGAARSLSRGVRRLRRPAHPCPRQLLPPELRRDGLPRRRLGLRGGPVRALSGASSPSPFPPGCWRACRPPPSSRRWRSPAWPRRGPRSSGWRRPPGAAGRGGRSSCRSP